MKNLTSSIIILIFFFCFYQPMGIAQIALTAVPFLEINNDARSMGMAGANVAMKNSRSGMHLNPATFGRKNTIEISTQINGRTHGRLFGTDWLPGFNASNLFFYSPQLILGFDKLSVGYQYTHLDLGTQIYMPEPGIVANVFNSHERAHTFSASYGINEHVSVGLGMNAIKSNLATGAIFNGQRISAPSRISWDLGFYADRPFQKDFLSITPSFGWSLTDIGKPISYTPLGGEDPLPIIMRGGLGLNVAFIDQNNGLEVLNIGGYVSRSKIMARNKDDGTPMGPFEAIFRSWDSFTRFNGMEEVTLTLKDQLRKYSGIEFTLIEIFSLRFGRFYEHPDNGARKFNTYGFGIHYKVFTMDVAEINTDERGNPLDKTTYIQLTANIPFN